MLTQYYEAVGFSIKISSFSFRTQLAALATGKRLKSVFLKQVNFFVVNSSQTHVAAGLNFST